MFGQVKSIETNLDETGAFSGTVVVEYETELEAKRASSQMMGFNIEDKVLFVKKLTTVSGLENQQKSVEAFKALIDDKPTACLCIRNIV